MQIQEFDDSCEELAAGIKCLKEILKMVAFMRENNYYLRSSSNMRGKVLNTLHAFTIKTATVCTALARARNRFTYLASSPLAYILKDDVLNKTEEMLKESEANLITARSYIPELQKFYEGEVRAGELD